MKYLKCQVLKTTNRVWPFQFLTLSDGTSNAINCLSGQSWWFQTFSFSAIVKSLTFACGYLLLFPNIVLHIGFLVELYHLSWRHDLVVRYSKHTKCAHEQLEYGLFLWEIFCYASRLVCFMIASFCMHHLEKDGSKTP